MLRRLLMVQTPDATPGSTPEVVAFGDSPEMPAAIGDTVTAGPLTITVLEVIVGVDAAEMLAAAWSWNRAPAPEQNNVVVRVRIANNGDRAIPVDNDDFGFVTSARRIWARQELVPPEPELNGVIEPGAGLEGWVAGVAEDDLQILMIVNIRVLGGTWNERYFALTDGASLSTDEVEQLSINTVGKSVSTPVSIGEQIVTRDWALTMTGVAYAGDVVALFPPEDYRTTALASADPSVIPYWIAFQLEIRHAANVSGTLHWPVDALSLANDQGESVQDVRILSSPLPDLQGSYLPGGVATGWHLIELPLDSAGNILRFQPSWSDPDARFVTWSDGMSSPVADPA